MGSAALTFVANDASQGETLDATSLVTGLSSTVDLVPGELVLGAGIPAGTTISQLDSSTSITLSQAATFTGSTELLFPRSYDPNDEVYVVGQNVVSGQTVGTLTVLSCDPYSNRSPR